jgi:hypothetical protein
MDCVSRQPCKQLCGDSSSFCSSWLESAEPQRTVMSVDLSWSSSLDMGFICKCVLPYSESFEPDPFPRNNSYDTFSTGTWPHTRKFLGVRRVVKTRGACTY